MHTEHLPYRAALDDYERQAAALLGALQAGDEAALWRFKWGHPRFREKTAEDVRAATLTLGDARTVVAQEYSFDTWDDLRAFANDVASGGSVAQFEAAVDALVGGDLETLRAMLANDPELVRKRSARRHHCTLLHYLSANGVEAGRQRTPANAVAIAKLLLDHGAEPDARADLYDHECTTMSMLVSSSHPAAAGLQVELAETLLDYGARLEQSTILTALTFGYRDTAEALSRRAGSTNDIAEAAGLGRVDDVARLLPSSDAKRRHIALALAAQLGHTDVVRLLLDAGEDPSRMNPAGFHAHATPLHHAVWNDRDDVVRLLVERGARLDIRDAIYLATPLEWAVYGKKVAIADYLRAAT